MEKFITQIDFTSPYTVMVILGLSVLLVAYFVWRTANRQQQIQERLFSDQVHELEKRLIGLMQQQVAGIESKISGASTQTMRLQHQHQEASLSRYHQVSQDLVRQLGEFQKQHREESSASIHRSFETLSKEMAKLTEQTDKRLNAISDKVEQKLTEGFEKTTKTFNDIVTRLALIDDAQKKITELSSNVVSLQEVLNDKRSRGAFGETQLSAIIRNMLPEKHFALQHILSNQRIADCMLFLPEPTGNIVIDSKFPLENYRKMTDTSLAESDRNTAQRQFKVDVKKHINDIAEKYILPNETSDSAMMFIPAEAIFAEIHGFHPELVELAYQRRVWLSSPTTMMAILTTARAVIKDDATRGQMHIIQEHLSKLSEDFGRFKNRFANLARHIDQAATDVQQIHTSAEKISARFDKIEQVDIDELPKIKHQEN